MAAIGASQGAGMNGSVERVIIAAHDRATREHLHEVAERASGHQVSELPIIDGFAVTLPVDALQDLRRLTADSGEEVRILPDTTVRLDEPAPGGEPAPPPLGLDKATRALELDKIWEQGFKGKGVGIAVLDTGIAPHPDVARRIVGFKDFINGREEPYDDRGHGTHVAGIAAGDGTASSGRYTGAAPEASLIGIKVMNSNGEGQLSDIIAGIQWAIENKDRLGIRVINMSLGSRPAVPMKDDPLAQAAVKATEAGLLVVAAAGNKGPYPETIDTPAASPAVLAVGATIGYATADIGDDKVAWYSGSGPTSFDHFVKPDVVAPGTNVACPDAATGKYAWDTGTSMASPLVAGAAALMIQARPDLRPQQVHQLMRETSKKIRSYDENVQGKGVPRPLILLEMLTNPKTPTESGQVPGSRAE